MNEAMVDLHTHTACSHGRFTASRVLELAAGRGLAAVAITDHNTTAGLAEASQAGEQWGVEVVGGCEFSAEWHSLELHVLGLFLDHGASGFAQAMAEVAKRWRERLERMMERLHQQAGLRVTWDDLHYTGHLPVVTTLAEAIGRQTGMTARQVFDAYLEEERPAYVAPLVDLGWVARTVHDLGGLCIMAHPWAYDPATVVFTEADFLEMKAAGADGLECYHPGQDAAGLQERVRLTHGLGMLVSGGSDCHGAGPGQEPRLGSQQVPRAVLEELRAGLAGRS